MQVTGRLRESLCGAERCRSRAGCEKDHAGLSNAGLCLVVTKLIRS